MPAVGTAPSAQTPTIVIPTVTSAPAVTAPVATPAAPVTADPAPTAPTRAATTPSVSKERARSTSTRVTAAAPAVTARETTSRVPVAPEPVQSASTQPANVAMGSTENAVTAPVESAAAPAANPDDSTSPILPIAGLALLGVLGAAGFAASRRKHQRVAMAQYEVIEPQPRAPSVDAPAVIDDNAPVVTGTPTVNYAWATAPVPAPAMGDDGPVPTGAEREALLARMVAAAPDAANPFTSHKARRRRARIILQAREHRQAEAGGQMAPLPQAAPAARPERTAPVRERTPVPDFAFA